MNHIIFSFLAAFGFSIVFNIKGKNVLIASLGGVIAWCIFIFLALLIPDDIIRYFVASVIISLYSRRMAKVRKCPVLVFLVIAFIPLVPGYSIFKTMEYLLLGDVDNFIITAVSTFKIVMAISTGFLLTTNLNMNFKR